MPIAPPTQHTRINLSDLKQQIDKKLGPDRSMWYFSCLNKWLAQKLSKPEFDKHCMLILGRENIPLHNQLVRAILKNAFQAKSPPPLGHEKAASRPSGAIGKKSSQGDDSINRSAVPMQMPTMWSNGDILPLSPCKVRSCIRERRIRDCSSPLGPHAQTDSSKHQSSALSDENGIRQNGVLSPCDFKRPMHHHQGVPSEQPAKRLWTENLTPNDGISLPSKGIGEVVIVEDREEVDQTDELDYKISPLRAPLGIPFCPASVGGARRSFPSGSNSSIAFSSSNFGSKELCDTVALKQWMAKIAEVQGLEGVTMDCSNLLNNGLDAYLKRLIRSCIDLVEASSGLNPVKHRLHRQQGQTKPINGVWHGNHMHVQSSDGSLDYRQGMRKHCSISLQDFRVAMELNSHQLGEDWSLLLEKICLHSYRE